MVQESWSYDGTSITRDNTQYSDGETIVVEHDASEGEVQIEITGSNMAAMPSDHCHVNGGEEAERVWARYTLPDPGKSCPRQRYEPSGPSGPTFNIQIQSGN